MENWLSDENQMLQDARKPGMNYMIQDGDAPESLFCAVYCSSNGLYFPNNKETFVRRIYEQNKYDWKRNRLKGVRKHIYIRDVYKQWYTEGISEEIASVEEIATFLKKVGGNGAEFVFLGSSAGGYMALVLGSLLGGIVFASSPQTKLDISPKNWLLEKHCREKKYARWYDITETLRHSQAEQYIFYAAENKQDIDQLKDVRRAENLWVLPVRTDKHGVVFFPFNASALLARRQTLRKISDSHRIVTAMQLSVRLCGYGNTFMRCMQRIIQKKWGKRQKL